MKDTKYCLVIDGKFVMGACYLPMSWNNISGLCNLSDEELASHGWLPFEANENEDEANFKQVGSTLEITDTKVTQVNEFVERTKEEKEEYQAYLKQQAARFEV